MSVGQADYAWLRVRRLPVRSVDIHSRQVLHLLFGERDSDAIVDPGHRADRDGDLFATAQVPLLEKDMGDVVVASVEDDPLDPSDVAVGGVHLLASSYGYLAEREGVIGDGLRDTRHGARGEATSQAVVGPREHLVWVVGPIAIAVGSR